MKRYALAIAALLAWPALAQQRVPELRFTSVPDYPTLPDGMNFGEVAGVAVNARGHVFVFSRSNSATGETMITSLASPTIGFVPFFPANTRCRKR